MLYIQFGNLQTFFFLNCLVTPSKGLFAFLNGWQHIAPVDSVYTLYQYDCWQIIMDEKILAWAQQQTKYPAIGKPALQTVNNRSSLFADHIHTVNSSKRKQGCQHCSFAIALHVPKSTGLAKKAMTGFTPGHCGVPEKFMNRTSL